MRLDRFDFGPAGTPERRVGFDDPELGESPMPGLLRDVLRGKMRRIFARPPTETAPLTMGVGRVIGVFGIGRPPLPDRSPGRQDAFGPRPFPNKQSEGRENARLD